MATWKIHLSEQQKFQISQTYSGTHLNRHATSGSTGNVSESFYQKAARRASQLKSRKKDRYKQPNVFSKFKWYLTTA